MRILIITQVFPPEIHPTGQIVLELSRSMSDAGHEVTVAAGYPHHPHGKVIGDYRKRRILHETMDGVHVVRGRHYTTMSSSFLARGLVYVSQSLGTAIAALINVRPQIVLNFGPPLVGPAISVLLARWFGARNVPVIYDLYPDLAAETGAVRNGAVIGAAKMLERWVYRRSDRIVVLSEGFRRTLVETKGVPVEKIRVIPAWIDSEYIRKAEDSNSWRRRVGIPIGSFVVLYAGTIGLISGAEIMIKVARDWVNRQDVVFLFVGEGKAKERIRVEAQNLPNVRFFDFQPREQLSEMLSGADVGVMTLLPGRGRTSVPSKVFGYMAVGVPVLASCDPDSDSASMIRNAGCGIVVPPGDAVAFSEALQTLHSNTEFRHGAGSGGRIYLEEHFSRKAGIRAFLSLIGELECKVDKE